MSGVVGTIDRFQQRHPRASVPLAVAYKFFDDQGNYLAATLSYYMFIAVFPLMLLGTSILGFVLEGRPHLRDQILNSALSTFPIIGDQLGRPEGLQGSTTGVVVGSLAALYGTLGLGQALQNTMAVAWSIPRNSRPNPILIRLKSVLLLVTAGGALLTVSIVSTIASTTEAFNSRLDAGLKAALPLITVLVVGGTLTLLFRVAAAHDHSFMRAMPGAFALAVMWQGLQYLGAAYVSHVLVDTSAMNQTFGLVLGLIGFIYIGAVMAVVAMEINVVLARKLYPRALLTPFTDRVHLTHADRRAYTSYARAQRHKGFEKVAVSFDNGVHINGAPAEESAGEPAEESAGEATKPAADDTKPQPNPSAEDGA